MKHKILKEKISLAKIFFQMPVKLFKPYLEYEERVAEFKR